MKISDIKKYEWFRYKADRATNLTSGSKKQKLVAGMVFGVCDHTGRRDMLVFTDGTSFLLGIEIVDRLMDKCANYKGSPQTIQKMFDEPVVSSPVKVRPTAPNTKIVRQPVLKGNKKMPVVLTLPKNDLRDKQKAAKTNVHVRDDDMEDEQDRIMRENGHARVTGAPAFEYHDLPEDFQDAALRRSFSSSPVKVRTK